MSETHAVEGHGDHQHDHPSWLAHHFDDAEQQFDAGKFGMWMFLVTEVLFFSGMFCAYSLLRSQNPEVFAFSSKFLNTNLGAINTLVLLFSSLTMAWAVRASQLSQHKTLVGMLAATLSCAAIFLGVKSVEYSHKWDLGLLPGKHYQTQGVIVPPHEVISPYLFWLCVPAAICLVCFLAWWASAVAKRDSVQKQVSGSLLIAAICFFGGVLVGRNLESGKAGAEGKHGTTTVHSANDSTHAIEKGAEHGEVQSATHLESHEANGKLHNSGPAHQATFVSDQAHPDQVFVKVDRLSIDSPEVNQKGRAGLFFSVYYCMTGVHALHILGGMVVISWLIVKAARKEFHSKYFGPVDNVGLYWHLVDFIWIYLFPLLYLI